MGRIQLVRLGFDYWWKPAGYNRALGLGIDIDINQLDKNVPMSQEF